MRIRPKPGTALPVPSGLGRQLLESTYVAVPPITVVVPPTFIYVSSILDSVLGL